MRIDSSVMALSPLLWTPLLSFALAVGAHVLAIRYFPRLGLLDFPERYGHQRGRIPYPTGILLVLLFLAFFLALDRDWNAQSFSVAAAVVLLALVSFIDDRRPLHPAFRLGVQLFAALLVFVGGARIYSFSNPLGEQFGVLSLDTWTIDVPGLGRLPILSGVFTVVWLGLTTNAMNWFDGIPGQVSTLSTLGFLTIGLLSISSRVQQPSLALLAFILAGLSAGALVFDFPPARVLMGDTGAMFLGFMLGLLTIYSGGKVATAFLVLGVPLIDLVIVMVRRVAKRRAIWHGSRGNEHLHHRLQRKGWSDRSIILLTALIGTLFGISALFLNTAQKAIAAVILFTLMLALSRYSRTPLPSSHA